MGPVIDVAAVRRALDYWTSVIGVEFVIVPSLVETPRIAVHRGASPRSAVAVLWACDADNWSTVAAIVVELRISEYVYRHELGHVLGFWGHSTEGLMAETIARSSDELSPRERQMMVALYSLPAGTSVQPDGAYVTGAGESGQLTDTQAASDIVDFNLPAREAGGLGTGCRSGVTKRWRSPVSVYVQQ